MWHDARWLIFCLGISLSFQCHALDLQQSSVSTESVSKTPFSAVTIDASQQTRYMRYNLHENNIISPYVAFGEEEETAPDEVFWRNHSYESVQEEDRSQQSWAGLKIRLHDMFKLDIDAKQRKVHSTMSLAPQTKVKFRANFKEIRADIIYRF